MKNIDSKTIKNIPNDELISLWNSGLGQCFCEDNKNDIDVLSINNNAIFYEERGREIKKSAFLWFFISILIFLFVYLILDFVDISNVGFLAIVSGVFCVGFFLGGAVRFLKSRRFFEAAKKLRNFDLSGFDIEDYVPIKKGVMRKSIEWGLAERKLTIEDGKIKPVQTSLHAADENPQ